jgi:hypothetical protein
MHHYLEIFLKHGRGKGCADLFGDCFLLQSDAGHRARQSELADKWPRPLCHHYVRLYRDESWGSIAVITWFGADGAFTDIKVGTYHARTSWAPNFVDRVATNVATESSTRCPTGTIAATANVDDLVVATCDNFNAAQTWGPLNGFTSRTGSSRNTAGWYDATVSSTGTQTATIPLSFSDLGVGMIAAFATK